MTLDFASLASSNSIISIIIFLIFMIVLFIVFLRIGTAVLSYLFSLNGHVKLINGMVSANKQLTISQDPSISGSILVERSSNQKGGIELTWSVWCFFDIVRTTNMFNNIFVKGTNDFSDSGKSKVNCPGVYISNIGELCIIVNTFTEINKVITIPNIPLSNWVQIVMTCQDKTLNVYLNGILIKSVILLSVIDQNYGDVYIGSNNGFSGLISNVWYWNKALTSMEIQNLYAVGPNTRSTDASLNDYKNIPKTNYLSLGYYMQ
jgi:hypothetical protein